MANTSWMGNLEELYRGMKDKWVRFPTRGTPLFTATHLSNVLIDGSGDMWFVLHNGMSTQIAHSLNSGNALTLEWKTSPAVIVKAARTEFSCRVSQKINGRVELLYRIDEGAWKQFGLIDSQQPLVVENLPNGMHKIEVRAYDEIFRASQPLTAAFEVKRDYNEEIQDLISQLRDIERREAAARTLIAIGKQAVPVLKDQLEKADSSSQWWIRAILDEIGRTDK
jgi:translation initiation factor 2B subunit (eIF-2B alpha/beta/delta family)